MFNLYDTRDHIRGSLLTRNDKFMICMSIGELDLIFLFFWTKCYISSQHLFLQKLSISVKIYKYIIFSCKRLIGCEKVNEFV